jgi:hypothetical protein
MFHFVIVKFSKAGYDDLDLPQIIFFSATINSYTFLLWIKFEVTKRDFKHKKKRFGLFLLRKEDTKKKN